MSAFECNVTPTRIRNAKKRTEDREPTVVDLRPFTGKSVVTFEDVPVSKVARRVITVINPFPEPIKVFVLKKPKAEFNLAIEWLENEISSEGSVDMEVIFSPLKVVTTREILEISDHFGNKKSVAIILKSCELKKLAPRKTGGLTGTLRLKMQPHSNPLVRPNVNQITVSENFVVEKEKVPQVIPAKSPLRNATNFQKNDKSEANVTPRNASALFSNIKFTPLTETKPKTESKLEYLSSLPTPGPVSREDIEVSCRREMQRNIYFSPEIEINRIVKETSTVVVETPVRKTVNTTARTLTSKMTFEECEEIFSDDVFASDTFVKGPCELNEIDIVISHETEATFKINKSKSFSECIETTFDHPQRLYSESMRVDKVNEKVQLAVQGSMPNLCDMSVKHMPINQNRYYEGANGGGTLTVLNTQNMSMESIVSNADFGEIEMCAASSRLNLNEIGRSPVQTEVVEKPAIETPPNAKVFASRLMAISPPRNKLTDDLREMCRRENFSPKQQKQAKSPYVFIVPRIPRDTGLRSQHKPISQSLTSLSSSSTSLASTSSVPATSGKLYNENVFSEYTNFDIFSPATLVDPFLMGSMFLDERTLDGIMNSLKKWLNALVTIPADLEAKKDEKIDVAKLFNDVQNKELTLAPTKETVCSRYYTARLDLLRSLAIKFFHTKEISVPLNKLAAIIMEKKLLEVNSARFIHRDLVLQRSLMELLLCFNPLWLRIGIEVVFNVQLNLRSNHDIFGLSQFIINNLFKCQYLQQKFSKYHQQEELHDKLRKHTAKHFLFILFFLDHAKEAKLIKQNPCLFMKTAPYKDSNEILKKFASLVLANYGDIIRMLKRMNYTLSHKQTVIDEFDYAFENLAVDLRDGVRLTKVMEIILLRDDLVKRVRVPAISRLQKLHNIELALNALAEGDFKIMGNISSRDIADGHREKTLSLLWQIIHKFRAPRFNAAAIVIQKFWRAKRLAVVIERRIKKRAQEKLDNAATVIQKYYRGWKTRREIEAYRVKVESSVIVLQKYARGFLARKKLKEANKSAICIQKWFRSVKVMREVRLEYQNTRNSIVKIQKWWRNQLMAKKLIVTAKIEREMRNEENCAAKKIQKYFRGYLQMKKDREEFLRTKNAIVKVQERYRARLVMKQERSEFLIMKSAAVKIQQFWRATIEMRKQKIEFTQTVEKIVFIQRKFRAKLAMKKERTKFLKLKSAAIVIQRRFRARQEMKKCRQNYLKLKSAVLTVENRFLATQLMKIEREKFLSDKMAIVKVQRRFRSLLVMKQVRMEYQVKRQSVIKIQQFWRATIEMRKQKIEYTQTVQKIVFIQQKFRAKLAMKKARSEFQALKSAAIIIQRRLRAHLEMKKQRSNFLNLKSAVLTVENRILANRFMQNERKKFENIKNSVIIIQRWYRNVKVTQSMQVEYKKKKTSILLIQKWWRRQLLARKIVAVSNLIIEMRNEKIKAEIEAAIKIQKYFRGYLQLKKDYEEFSRAKNAIVKIQKRFRARLVMKQERSEFLIIKSAAIKIQQFWRATIEMRKQKIEFTQTVEKIVFIQRKFRAKLAMKKERTEFLKLKSAAIVIQRRFRAHQKMIKEQTNYLSLKAAVLTVENRFLATRLMKIEREKFLSDKTAIVKVQRRFRSLLVMKQVRKEYQVKRQSVIKIQQFWRATIEMRKQKIEYTQTVQKIVFIQQKFRAKLAMKKVRSEFQALKSAAIIIQKRFRAHLEMKKQRSKFLNLKSAVLTVENRILANRLMKVEREKFVHFVQTVIFVQKTFLMKLEARKLHREFKATRKSVLLIQTYSRGYLARRHFHEHLATPENLELRRQQKAARTLQAAWRGFKERSKKSNLCFRVIVQRLIKVSKNVDPTQTLASKLKMSLDFLRNRYDSNLAIATLAKLEYMARTVPWILTVDAEFISVFCYGIMAQAIRSEVDKQVIELCSCIILNLGRFNATKEDAFQESGLLTIASMLLRWCDKDCGIFNTLCTLIWVFSQCPKKKKIIRKFMMMKDGEFTISQIKQFVARKENMRRNSRRPIGFQSLSLVKYKKDYQMQLSHQPQTVYSSGYITPEMMKLCRQFPSIEPDYGVVRMHPYIFYSSVFAFEEVLKALNISSN